MCCDGSLEGRLLSGRKQGLLGCQLPSIHTVNNQDVYSKTTIITQITHGMQSPYSTTESHAVSLVETTNRPVFKVPFCEVSNSRIFFSKGSRLYCCLVPSNVFSTRT